jgi:hypothetical protein
MNRAAIEQPPTYVPPPQIPAPPLAASQVASSGVAQDRAAGRKFKAAFFATLAFVALSHGVAYRLMNQVFWAFTGRAYEIVTEVGVPTPRGLFLHAVVFFLVVLVLFRGV